MSVFDVFYILQMVPNRATHHIYLKEALEVRKFIKKKKNSDRDLENSDDLKV